MLTWIDHKDHTMVRNSKSVSVSDKIIFRKGLKMQKENTETQVSKLPAYNRRRKHPQNNLDISKFLALPTDPPQKLLLIDIEEEASQNANR